MQHDLIKSESVVQKHRNIVESTDTGRTNQLYNDPLENKDIQQNQSYLFGWFHPISHFGLQR